MAWFSGITALFGSAKNIDTIVSTAAKGIYNGLDMFSYTDEEKAISRTKGSELFLRFIEKTLDQNNIRSVTRRWLAFMVVGPMMICFVLSGLTYPFSAEMARHLFNLFQTLVPWGSGILAFYFGPHLIGAIIKKIKS